MPTVPKPDLVQIEWIFYDACGGHSHTQDVLLCWQVVRRRHPVYLHQVAGTHIPFTSRNFGMSGRETQNLEGGILRLGYGRLMDTAQNFIIKQLQPKKTNPLWK